MGKRLKDNEWTVDPGANGNYSMEAATLVVLMDVRDELKKLNGVFGCYNFQSIPHTLKGIRKKLPTPKPRKRK